MCEDCEPKKTKKQRIEDLERMVKYLTGRLNDLESSSRRNLDEFRHFANNHLEKLHPNSNPAADKARAAAVEALKDDPRRGWLER